MKKHVLSKTIFAALAAFLSVAALHAQSDTAPAGDAKMTAKKQHGDQLARDLNLSEEQKAKFRKIDEEYAAKARERRAARKEESAKMREERIKAHKAVLTPDQAAKYDKIVAKKQAKKENRKEKDGRKEKTKRERKEGYQRGTEETIGRRKKTSLSHKYFAGQDFRIFRMFFLQKGCSSCKSCSSCQNDRLVRQPRFMCSSNAFSGLYGAVSLKHWCIFLLRKSSGTVCFETSCIRAALISSSQILKRR